MLLPPALIFSRTKPSPSLIKKLNSQMPFWYLFTGCVILETGQGGSTTFGGTSHRVGPPSPVMRTVLLLELSDLSQTGLGGTGMGAQNSST